MIYNLKALVVVLVLACAVFWLAAPLMSHFMAKEDWRRRVGVWFALTIAGFASPNFWFYLIVAAPLLLWAGRRDSNVAALALLLLHVIPPAGIELPALFINRLFDLNNFRLLALLLLVPAAFGAPRAVPPGAIRAPLRMANGFMLAFLALTLVMLMPYESPTNTMRRAFLFMLDAGLWVYVFSRLCIDTRKFDEAAAAFCLGVAAMAAISVFESARGWLLYTNIAAQWGAPNEFSWLMRGEQLRAQAAAGHSLAFGYLCAMAFGLWLYLQRRVAERKLVALAFAVLLAGLAASVSRGPWIVAALTFTAYAVLAPRKPGQLIKQFSLIGLVCAAVLVSPWGAAIIDRLPFIGTVGADTVDYRQRLAEVSWRLIWTHPLFGDPFVLYQMEELRQGQGIIDLVNSYMAIALFYGFVGLALMMGGFLGSLALALRDAHRLRRLRDDERCARSAALAACMIGTLLMLAVGSFGTSLALLFWLFTGMASGVAARHAVLRVAAVPRSRTAMPGPRGAAVAR